MTIQEFPLAWRWTQPSHSVLPAEVLAGIRPLSASEATRVSRAAPAETAAVVSRSASDSEDLRYWLRSLQPDSETSVYISWNNLWAVETSWKIFTEYWDDFCYPSSDDITVLPT